VHRSRPCGGAGRVVRPRAARCRFPEISVPSYVGSAAPLLTPLRRKAGFGGDCLHVGSRRPAAAGSVRRSGTASSSRSASVASLKFRAVIGWGQRRLSFVARRLQRRLAAMRAVAPPSPGAPVHSASGLWRSALVASLKYRWRHRFGERRLPPPDVARRVSAAAVSSVRRQSPSRRPAARKACVRTATAVGCTRSMG